ncbi:MAG: hypothetical protein HQ521_03865 [Bacteroidetes bacterium]|nr:hypothetical protein [Bacteroidota bacterium]
MKTIALSLTLLVLATFSFAQFPQSSASDSCCYVTNDLRAAIIDNDRSTVDVKIAKLPNEVVKIRVRDNNEIIHQTRVKKEEIVDLKFDLVNYPEGKYVFEILKKNQVVYSKEIEFNNENIAFAKK